MAAQIRVRLTLYPGSPIILRGTLQKWADALDPQKQVVRLTVDVEPKNGVSADDAVVYWTSVRPPSAIDLGTGWRKAKVVSAEVVTAPA